MAIFVVYMTVWKTFFYFVLQHYMYVQVNKIIIIFQFRSKLINIFCFNLRFVSSLYKQPVI